MSISSKKIAIYHNLPGGGGIRMLTETVNWLNFRGYQIDVYTIGESCLEIKHSNVFFKKINIPKNFFLKQLYIYFFLPIIHKKTAEEINSKYDICILNHDYLTKSPYIMRFLKIKKIYICHESQREFYEKPDIHTSSLREIIVNYLRYPIKFVDKVNVRYANVVITNSKYSKKIIDKIYHVNSKIVYPGVDSNFFKPSKKINKKNKILAIGGLNPTKDPLFLVKSLSPMLAKYNLTLVGGGKDSYVSKVKKLCRGLNVTVLTSINDKDLRKLYRESLLTCVVAHKEPFGLTSIESQACGTPVVVTNDGGLPETVTNNITGYICNRDTNSLIKSVKKCIKNSYTLGASARKISLSRWQWGVTLRPLGKIISDELKNS